MEDAKSYIKKARKDIAALEDFIAASEAICRHLDDPKELSIILSSVEVGTKAILGGIEKYTKGKIDAEIYRLEVQTHIDCARDYATRVLNDYKPKEASDKKMENERLIGTIHEHNQ